MLILNQTNIEDNKQNTKNNKQIQTQKISIDVTWKSGSQIFNYKSCLKKVTIKIANLIASSLKFSFV